MTKPNQRSKEKEKPAPAASASARPVATTRKKLSFLSIVTPLLIFLGVTTFLMVTGRNIGLTNDAPGWVIYPSLKEGTWITDLMQGRWGRVFDKAYTEEKWDLPIKEGNVRALPPAARCWFWTWWKMFAGSLSLVDGYRLGMNALYGLFLAILIPWLKKRYGGVTGWTTGGLLLLSPHLFAYAQFISTDMPVAILIILGTLAFHRALLTGKWNLFFVCYALAFLTKQQGILFPLPLILWAWWVSSCHPDVKTPNAFRFMIQWAAVSGVLIVLLWPRLWNEPIPKLLSFLSDAFIHGFGGFYFNQFYGTVVAPNPRDSLIYNVPRHYSLVMLVLTTPPAVLLLAAAGIAKMAIERKAKDISTVLASIAGFYILLTLVVDSGRVHQIRYFVSAVMCLTIIAGIGTGFLADQIASRLRFRGAPLTGMPRQWVKIAAVVLPVGLTGLSLGTVAPHGTAYYNLIIGGSHGAQNYGLESSFWTTGMNREFCSYLNANARPNARLFMFDVTGSLSVHQAEGTLRRDLVVIGMQANPDSIPPDAFAAADYFISLYAERMRSYNCLQPMLPELMDANTQPVFAVEPAGEPLLRLYSKDHLIRDMTNVGDPASWSRVGFDLGAVVLEGARRPSPGPYQAGTTAYAEFLFRSRGPPGTNRTFAVELATDDGKPVDFFDAEWTHPIRLIKGTYVRNPDYGKNPVHPYQLVVWPDLNQSFKPYIFGANVLYKLRIPVKVPPFFPEGRFRVQVSELSPDPASRQTAPLGTIEVHGRQSRSPAPRIVTVCAVLLLWFLGLYATTRTSWDK